MLELTQVTPYRYGFSSPFAFANPDGNDERIKIKPNANGGGTITIE